MASTDVAKDIRQMGRLAYWVALAIVFLHLGQDYWLGGNTYKQGDWLINVELATVRRGLPGSAFIRIADFLHIDLLLVVVLCQAALLALFAVCLYKVVRKVDHQPLFWLLLFSPGFTLLLWANDPQGSLRKELIVYAAFALLLAGLADRRRLHFAVATGLFALGMLGHEANCLFLPVFLWLLYCARGSGMLATRELGLAVLVLLAAALVSATFFFRHVSLADAGPVCAPLLLRGFTAAFCEGAISWVTRDLSYAIRVTAGNWSAGSWAFGTFYLWMTALACWISAHFVQMRKLLWMYVCTALPFLPLFYVALDWGRWMNFHLSCWIFVVLAEQLLGGLQLLRPVDGKRLLVSGFSILPWAPSHMTYLVLPRAVLVIAAACLLRKLTLPVMGQWIGKAGEGERVQERAAAD